MPAPVPTDRLACIALGSNLGDRAAAIAGAINQLKSLPASRFLASSSTIETAPVRVTSADPGGPYLNAAATLRTALPARELLDALHEIERRLGRDRLTQPHGTARALDLDLLMLGDLVIREPGLTLPHPRMQERRFVLEPLAQIAPDAVVPSLGKTVRELLARLASGTAALLLVFVSLVGLLGPVQHAGAQPPPPPLKLPAEMFLAEAAKAYQTGPTAERIAITVKTRRALPGGTGGGSGGGAGSTATDQDRSEITLRLDPGDAKTARAASMLIEMGALRVYAREGKLAVVSTTRPTVYWEADYPRDRMITPARLAELLQPIPLPGLLLLAPSAAYGKLSLLPWNMPSLDWDEVVTKPADKDPIKLEGRTRAGPIRLELEETPVPGKPRAEALRLKHLFARLPGQRGAATGDDQPTIDLAFTPIPPGEPSVWRPDLQGRRRVESLSELRPQSKESLVGQKFPLGSLTARSGESIKLEGFFVPPASPAAPARTSAAPSHLFLVLTRPAAVQDPEHPTESLEAVATVACQQAPGACQPALTTRLERVRVEGAAPPAAPSGPAPASADWSFWAPEAPLAKLSPDDCVCIVVLDHDLVIRALLVVDADSMDPDKLATELARVLCPKDK